MLKTGCSQNNNAVCLQRYLFLFVSGRAVLCLLGIRLKERCSTASTADQAFPWFSKESERGKKQTSLDCVAKMASHITFRQQGLAQIDKAAASILRVSWYSLCWGSSFKFCLRIGHINSESFLDSSEALFSL